MVKIRLSRTGRKNLPSYRVVITPAREKRESKVLEYIGTYSPLNKKIVIDAERAKYWLSVGAQPTDTIKRMLVKEGILEKIEKKTTFAKVAGKKSADRKTKKEAAVEKKEA